MASQAQPRRAEHLGSLLRPRVLIESSGHGKKTPALQETVGREIANIVALQQELGFAAISDGEYRRDLFWGSFFEDLEGFSEVPFDEKHLRTYLPNIKALLESGYRPGGSLVCTGKIKHSGRSNHVEEFRYLKGLVGPDHVADIKITMPAPSWYHLRFKQDCAYVQGVYSSDAEYFADLAGAYRRELQILYDEGLRRVQIDDPTLAYFCDPEVRKAWSLDSTNTQSPDELFETYIKWYNTCFSDVPSDMHVGIHICRGNFTDSRYWSLGGYNAIASKLFRDLNLKTYYLEYDSPRAGSFEPLKDLPLDKFVILGVVSTKTAQLEDVEVLKGRVLDAAKVIAEGNGVSLTNALQRLGVSPQCGFASHSREDRLTAEDMRAKLSLVRETANAIWPGEL